MAVSLPASTGRRNPEDRLEHVVVAEGRRSVRTDGRALRHSSKAGTCDDSRMEWRVVLHLADLRFPVLGGDKAPQPAPLRKLGGVGIQRIPHAGDLAVLHAVGGREDVESGTDIAGVR